MRPAVAIVCYTIVHIFIINNYGPILFKKKQIHLHKPLLPCSTH